MGDEIQVGDVFEPVGGPASQAVEVYALGALVGCRKLDNGVTFDVVPSLLLDPLKWTRAGHMGPRYAKPSLTDQLRAIDPILAPPDHVVPPLTSGMERKAAKWRPSLVPPGTVRAIAEAMQCGLDRGHVEDDWQKRPALVFYDATLRHLLAHAGGELVDPDSGLPHLDHALASLAILRNRSAAP